MSLWWKDFVEKIGFKPEVKNQGMIDSADGDGDELCPYFTAYKFHNYSGSLSSQTDVCKIVPFRLIKIVTFFVLGCRPYPVRGYPMGHFLLHMHFHRTQRRDTKLVTLSYHGGDSSFFFLCTRDYRCFLLGRIHCRISQAQVKHLRLGRKIGATRLTKVF